MKGSEPESGISSVPVMTGGGVDALNGHGRPPDYLFQGSNGGGIVDVAFRRQSGLGLSLGLSYLLRFLIQICFLPCLSGPNGPEVTRRLRQTTQITYRYYLLVMFQAVLIKIRHARHKRRLKPILAGKKLDR